MDVVRNGTLEEDRGASIIPVLLPLILVGVVYADGDLPFNLALKSN
jgi:hypothetical protein